MARPLRVEHEGAYWHVMQRGNDGQAIYRDDDDRRKFLELLATTVKRFRWQLKTWVLMTNHYHLVPQLPECTLSRGMHWLDSMYAQYFNRRHKRRGHLFGGRFKAQLIEEDSYLNEVLRYVVLNPVRAGMAAHPGDYEWSSYRALAGLEPAPEWLDDSWLLGLDKKLSKARKIYRDFVEEKINDKSSIWNGVVGQIYLGSAEWIEKMRTIVESKPRSDEHSLAQRLIPRCTMDRVIRVVAEACEIEAATLRESHGGIARMLAAWIGWNEAVLRLREIAAALRLRSSGYISTLVRECDEQLTRDKLLQSIATRAIDSLHLA